MAHAARTIQRRKKSTQKPSHERPIQPRTTTFRLLSPEIIIDCTSLSALSLVSDKTRYPLRGALIRVINDGKDFPKVESSLAITADAARDNEIVLVVPRNGDILLIGGVAQPGKWDLDLTLYLPEIKQVR